MSVCSSLDTGEAEVCHEIHQCLSIGLSQALLLELTFGSSYHTRQHIQPFLAVLVVIFSSNAMTEEARKLEPSNN